jgi:hypothetical protein
MLNHDDPHPLSYLHLALILSMVFDKAFENIHQMIGLYLHHGHIFLE